MTAYFDSVSSKIGSAELFGDTLNEIEDRLVTDVTVCAMMPGCNGNIAERIHKAVLRWGESNMPLNAPPVDYEHAETRRSRLHSLGSDLHDIFHDLARLGHDRFTDDPLTPLRCLYADGEVVREGMVEGAKRGQP